MTEPARHIEANKTTGEVVVDLPGRPRHRPPLKPLDGQFIEGGSTMNLSSVTSLPLKDSGGDIELVIGDVVNLQIEAKCIGKRYVTDKNGDLTLQHVLRPMLGGESVSVVPFDPSNPADDGVLRYTT